MDDLVPLSPEDRAILALESRTVAGHTCKVVRLDSATLDVERLRTRVSERIALAPALTRRLGGSERAPGWVPDESFDVGRHVVPAAFASSVDHSDLPALVARLFEERLDRTRPLWRMDVVDLPAEAARLCGGYITRSLTAQRPPATVARCCGTVYPMPQ